MNIHEYQAKELMRKHGISYAQWQGRAFSGRCSHSGKRT